jgi:hypothetical protein
MKRIYDKVKHSKDNTLRDAMRRDMDLFRSILLAIEASEDPGLDPISIHVQFIAYTDEEINYHLKLLQQSGFIDAEPSRGNIGINWVVTGLTPNGHDFLDASRNDTIWQKAKDIVVNRGGSFTLNFLFQTLADLVMKQLK